MPGLSGMDAIVDYCQKRWGWSRRRVKKMIDDHGLPAAKISGGWESDGDLIDKWHPLLIERLANGSAQFKDSQ